MMCRMIAFSSKSEIDAFPYFERLKEMAEHGKRSPHPDGWGFFCVSNEQVLYHRSEKPIFGDDFPSFKARLCIVHARKASLGTRKSVLSVHPFLFLKGGKIHSLAHNGSVSFDEKEIEELVTGVDTELMMKILANGDVEEMVESFKNRSSSLTFLMSDGTSLRAFRCCYKECDYFTLSVEESDGLVVISSEGSGRELKNGELILVKDGEIVEKNIVECGKSL
jgi:predicted glutamine amidotransferase